MTTHPHLPPISHLVALYLRMAPAEARILVRLAERIDQGRTEYGSFDPTTDRRDFLEEAAQESLDLLIYREMHREQAASAEGHPGAPEGESGGLGGVGEP